MQAAFQRHTDNAVSKTVNFPHDATREDVREVYLLVLPRGPQGGHDLSRRQPRGSGAQHRLRCTTARRKRRRPGRNSAPLPENYGSIEPRPRPSVTRGFTEKMNIGCGTLYVTVNYDETASARCLPAPAKAGGCPSQSEATARLASIALRSGISIHEVYDQLKASAAPRRSARRT
jgi:ribonucleoside-diphosphate reductase alpha chain